MLKATPEHWDSYQLGWSFSHGQIYYRSEKHCRATWLAGTQAELCRPGHWRDMFYRWLAGEDTNTMPLVGSGSTDGMISNAAVRFAGHSRFSPIHSLCGQGGIVSSITKRQTPMWGMPNGGYLHNEYIRNYDLQHYYEVPVFAPKTVNWKAEMLLDADIPPIKPNMEELWIMPSEDVNASLVQHFTRIRQQIGKYVRLYYSETAAEITKTDAELQVMRDNLVSYMFKSTLPKADTTAQRQRLLDNKVQFQYTK